MGLVASASTRAPRSRSEQPSHPYIHIHPPTTHTQSPHNHHTPPHTRRIPHTTTHLTPHTDHTPTNTTRTTHTYHTPTNHHTPHTTQHARCRSLREVGTSSLSFSAGVWLVAPATHWRTR